MRVIRLCANVLEPKNGENLNVCHGKRQISDKLTTMTCEKENADLKINNKTR